MHVALFLVGMALGSIVGALAMAMIAAGVAEDSQRERILRRCADRDAVGCSHNACNYARTT